MRHCRECLGWTGGPRRWGESPVDMNSIEETAVHLPVGTVTFMLTDVEGSTLLWESAAEAMGAAIRRHYQLLDAAVALHGGYGPRNRAKATAWWRRSSLRRRRWPPRWMFSVPFAPNAGQKVRR